MLPEILETLFGVDRHRSELDHFETSTVEADSCLSEEDRRTVPRPDRHGDTQQQRRAREQRQAGYDDIECSLDHQGDDPIRAADERVDRSPVEVFEPT